MVHEYDCYNEQDDYCEDIYYSYHWDFEDEEEMFLMIMKLNRMITIEGRKKFGLFLK